VRWDDLTDPSADTAVTTHHFEVPIYPAGAADISAHESAFNTFWNGISNLISSDVAPNHRRYYNVPPTPGAPSGDPIATNDDAKVGTASGVRLPPQVACSVTEVTAIRRRWGRFYLPGFTPTSLGPNGRVLGTVVAAIADAAEAYGDSLTAAGRPLVVLRQSDRTYQLVREVRVDNVWDIIRRRRLSTTTQRETRSILP